MPRPTRLRIETALAATSLALLLLTVLWRDWIELVLRVDPDRGSGALETGIAAGFVAATVLFALLARRERRRSARVEATSSTT